MKHLKPITYLCLFSWLLLGCGGSDGSGQKQASGEALPPVSTSYKINISTVEAGSAIYLNGRYTGEVTPHELEVESTGDYDIGIGLVNSRQYLKKSVSITGDATTNLILDDNDLQSAKQWRALFIGVNKVTDKAQSCVSEYTTQELDAGYEFFQSSMSQYVGEYSYNTVNWQFIRRDISDDTLVLSEDNLITPEVIEPYLTDVSPGDYDLIVTFFRGGEGATDDCFIDNFIGIAWFDVDVLNAKASYYTIRYYHDIYGVIDHAKQHDPGVFVHEWLHTVAERFYPNRGADVPTTSDGQVVHAAGNFNYQPPWMTWYQDLISGQVKRGNDYLGITPEALLACTVSESALDNCE